MREFRWNGRREEAALLVAQDEMTNEEIAARAGITRQGLDKWKLHPEFAARVESLVAAMADAVRARGIAERQNRVAALNDRWERLQAVMAARGREQAGVAGGETGLLIPQVKLVKVYLAVSSGEGEELVSGKQVAQVAEYAVDGVLLRELREHEKQAAQELGQWVEKREASGEVLVREYVGVDPEEV